MDGTYDSVPMRIYVVRHADAGSRREWNEPDHLRPLSPKGWERANELATVLDGQGIVRLLSSPYLRCTQTFGPLAAKQGLEVEEHPALTEGAALQDGMDLVEALVEAHTPAALCSHGDVIPELLAGLERRGTAVDPTGRFPKGSVWVLHADNGAITRATYAGKTGLLDG